MTALDRHPAKGRSTEDVCGAVHDPPEQSALASAASAERLPLRPLHGVPAAAGPEQEVGRR
eukprot:CAMPEP_0175445902 /NCGR_PEP_ID=MMETSP0095-20121207/59989_1 /TAXON_ID=311494 /ORGANISM="Alexandrium monilatum, Strain CCMP3105" /LENGTH=60 /DNA_ID=CAMNT_0016746149 /DNA_START=9 /DNA_END=188 /DNA_ORIENTATION=-